MQRREYLDLGNETSKAVLASDMQSATSRFDSTSPHFTNSEHVREFTHLSIGELPKVARVMTLKEVKFLLTMICEECMELVAATDDYVNPLAELLECAEKAKKPVMDQDDSEANVIANQGDAMVDVIYFCYNAAAKVGIDCDQIFNIVQTANMAKRFPDGTFHKDASGKIIKPDGWTPPDVKQVVEAWMSRGYTWRKFD